MAPPVGLKYTLVQGCCPCGHVGLQRLPYVCGKCVAAETAAKKVHGRTFVLGTCACGHEGWQKRPDICGPCVRDQNRPKRVYTPQQNQVRTASQRIESMILNFKKLPKDFQIEAIQRMTDLV